MRYFTFPGVTPGNGVQKRCTRAITTDRKFRAPNIRRERFRTPELDRSTLGRAFTERDDFFVRLH